MATIIRNPVDWGADQLKRAALHVESVAHSLHGTEEGAHSRRPGIRRVSELSQRAQAIAESVTMAVTAKAAEMRSAGKQVISFGAGEPDFPTPAHIVTAAEAACRDPKAHHYGPAGGLPGQLASCWKPVTVAARFPKPVKVRHGPLWPMRQLEIMMMSGLISRSAS